MAIPRILFSHRSNHFGHRSCHSWPKSTNSGHSWSFGHTYKMFCQIIKSSQTKGKAIRAIFELQKMWWKSFRFRKLGNILDMVVSQDVSQDVSFNLNPARWTNQEPYLGILHVNHHVVVAGTDVRDGATVAVLLVAEAVLVLVQWQPHWSSGDVEFPGHKIQWRYSIQ